MNGEIYQMASMVAAAKRAMQTANQIQYTLLKYENSIRFKFLPQRTFFRTTAYTADNVSEWFEQLSKNGMQDIKLLCPYPVKNRYLLGFSNTSQSSIVCYFKNNKVTYFVPNWKFDSAQKQWDIVYSEQEWSNPPAKRHRFENNTDSFRQVLVDIRNFASQIGSDYFADVFGSAISILDGDSEYPYKEYGFEIPQIPDKNLKLFGAAGHADVFGAMGSWNDEPSGAAHQKGLSEEYETLSDELLKNVRLAIMYAINEW